jgi:hypothetical protein
METGFGRIVISVAVSVVFKLKQNPHFKSEGFNILQLVEHRKLINSSPEYSPISPTQIYKTFEKT